MNIRFVSHLWGMIVILTNASDFSLYWQSVFCEVDTLADSMIVCVDCFDCRVLQWICLFSCLRALLTSLSSLGNGQWFYSLKVSLIYCFVAHQAQIVCVCVRERERE